MRPLSAIIVEKFARSEVCEDNLDLRRYKIIVLQDILNQRGTGVGKLLQALSLFFVLLTILIYIVETTDEVDEHQFIFRVIESISVAFFTMELLLTIAARYEGTFFIYFSINVVVETIQRGFAAHLLDS